MTNGYISLQNKEFVSGVKIFYGTQTGTAKVRTLYGTFPWVSWLKKKNPWKASFGSERNWFSDLLLSSFLLFPAHFSLLVWWVAFISCAQFQLMGGVCWTLSWGVCVLKLASALAGWRGPLLMPVAMEVGNSERTMATVVSSVDPDFHKFIHSLMKCILISICVKSRFHYRYIGERYFPSFNCT